MSEKPKATNDFLRILLICVSTAIATIVALFFLTDIGKDSTPNPATLVGTKFLAEPKAGGPLVFKDEAEFVQAVERAFETIVATRQKQALREKMQRYSNAPEDSIDGKHIYGSANARFTLVEYSDLECPYCKRFHETLRQIVDNSNSNVSWEWQHLALDFHNPAARNEAIASECVAEIGGNRKFWAFIDEVFVQTAGNGKGVPSVGQLVHDLDIDMEQFSQCMQEQRYADKVDGQKRKAESLGINGTPYTIIVDNYTGQTQAINGAQPVQAVMAAIQKLRVEQEELDQSSATDEPAIDASSDTTE